MTVLRVHGDEFVFPPSTFNQVAPRIPQMNMMKVHIPFTFKLVETSKSSYSGNAQFENQSRSGIRSRHPIVRLLQHFDNAVTVIMQFAVTDSESLANSI